MDLQAQQPIQEWRTAFDALPLKFVCVQRAAAVAAGKETARPSLLVRRVTTGVFGDLGMAPQCNDSAEFARSQKQSHTCPGLGLSQALA